MKANGDMLCEFLYANLPGQRHRSMIVHQGLVANQFPFYQQILHRPFHHFPAQSLSTVFRMGKDTNETNIVPDHIVIGKGENFALFFLAKEKALLFFGPAMAPTEWIA